ncbi:MAG: hypothetical protein EXS14_08305 [Planctomycetes bacterium]|nr:hypothetical protein [Planctomycetota bacterium]
MSELHSYWVQLLNAQDSWLTDEAMLSVIPAEMRDFSGRDWPRERALAYLHNNVSTLRLNHARLESGELMDLDMLNPVLGGVVLRLTTRRRSGQDRGVLLADGNPQNFNPGTVALRAVVHRAFFHFALYADWRLSDPVWPGVSYGMLRVLGCPANSCGKLVVCPAGRVSFCSTRCAEDTARPEHPAP